MKKPPIAGPVLITGCSTGVGHATARLFRGAGYETFATARDISTLEDLRALGCRTLALDVTDETARREAVTTIEREFGAVGILVNNAGYGQYGPLEEIPLDALRLQFETNVFGGLRLSQFVLPAMRKAGHGRIVNVSSVAGRVSSIGGGAYHATKFAIEALTDALRPADTGPQSPYAYFKQRLAQRMHRFLDPQKFGVMSAESVAQVVYKAATAARPRTRYNVGFIARLGPIGRALTPDRVVDAMTRWEAPLQKEQD